MWYLTAWSAIKSFFGGSKGENGSGNNLGLIFVGLLVLVISVFVYSNSSVILSKFGFETTTNLKAEVTRLQGELSQAKRINDKLNEDLKSQTSRHKAELEAVSGVYKEREKTKDKIIEVKTQKELKDRDTIKKLSEKMVVTPTEITIPIAEYDQLSSNNIDSITEVYDTFFKNERTPQ